jgi:peptidoglycan/LPS O-acetylase OafA/YrhL
VLTNLLDFELDNERIGLLNANLASSWSHRATAGTLLLGGAMATLRAQRGAGRRRLWGVTAAALILLFVVEVSTAHVQVDRVSYGKLIYVPLLACLVVCVLRLTDGSDQVNLLWLGLVVLAASYAVHLLGPPAVRALGWGTDSAAYQVKVGLKEGAELSGWMLLVSALWRSEADQPHVVPRPPVSRRVEASPMGCRQSEQA